MNFEIQVLQTAIENRGKYNMCTVDYKSTDGKLAQKKLMSFSFPDVFKALSTAKQGDIYTIETTKNDKNFWDWNSVSPGPMVGQVGGVGAAKPSTGNPSPKSTYETADERANRQVLIVRQSSVSSAVALTAANPKLKAGVGEVLEIAKSFEDYVFGRSDSSPSEFTDELESDVL